MAKLPKWPKQPKQKSSETVWTRYYERVKAVAAKRKAIKDAPKKKAGLKSKADAIKSKG